MLTQQFQNTDHTLWAKDKTLGCYDLTLTDSYKVKTRMINTAVAVPI